MKKLLFLLCILLCLATSALADNSRFYGLWQVTAKIGSQTESFMYAVGDRPYSKDAAAQWKNFTFSDGYPFEYVANGDYYYTKLPKQGDFLYDHATFVDNGSVSGHPGWIDQADLFVHINGNSINLDVYAGNPGMTDMYKAANITIDMNDAITHASLSGKYYDFATGGSSWRKNVTGTMDKVGYYANGQFYSF